MTNRTLPAPWEQCDMCGKAAGVPSVLRPDTALCPACTRWELLNDAATDSLREMISPILGAWAAHWTAAGVSLKDLEAATEYMIGSDLNSTYAKKHRRVHLRRLRHAYRAPAFECHPAGRSELRAADLPRLARWTPPAPAGGGYSAHGGFFTDTQGRAQTLAPGCDVLLISQPDGDTLLIYTGAGGYTGPTSREGLRVPAGLLPQVRALLSGEGRP